MATIVNMHEAKTQLSRIVERVCGGEDIILAKAGKPRIRLVPIDDTAKPRRQPGGLKLTGDMPDSVWFDPLPDDLMAMFEGRDKDAHCL